MDNKTILATCYAVDPYKGSENGMGWNFVYQIARYNKVIAITRENNKPAIDKFMLEFPDEVYNNITFLYFDLPYWMRFWKKGNRGALLYYYFWQKGIVSFIKKQGIHYDIVHNVNFHNDWTPTFLWKLNKPTVWGPIGHHPIIPSHFLKPYNVKYRIKDIATWMVKKTFWNFSPALNSSIKHSEFILCMNSGVEKVIDLSKKKKAIVPSVATSDYFLRDVFEKENFNLISVGRFVPLKGFDLTILTFAKFLKTVSPEKHNQCKLTLVGTGPEKEYYYKLIAENNIEPYVEIIEWIDRIDLMKLYDKASVFLFPSHEGAGMVVAEALSFGLPVVCLDNEGPKEFINNKCGFAVNQSSYDGAISAMSVCLEKLFNDRNLLNKMSIEARNHYLQNFTWDSRGDFLKEVYNKL